MVYCYHYVSEWMSPLVYFSRLFCLSKFNQPGIIFYYLLGRFHVNKSSIEKLHSPIIFCSCSCSLFFFFNHFFFSCFFPWHHSFHTYWLTFFLLTVPVGVASVTELSSLHWSSFFTCYNPFHTPNFLKNSVVHFQIILAGNPQGDLFASPETFFPMYSFFLTLKTLAGSFWTLLEQALGGKKITTAVHST